MYGRYWMRIGRFVFSGERAGAGAEETEEHILEIVAGDGGDGAGREMMGPFTNLLGF